MQPSGSGGRSTDGARGGAFRFRSKLERRIVRRAGEAVGDYDLIEDGDHVLVAVSGGKDSLALLEVLQLLRRRSPARFQLTAVTIDQGRAGVDLGWLKAHFIESGLPHHIEEVPIDQVVQEKLSPGAIPCSLCSRLRRGVLYSLAPRLGCTKIALGHHLDDLIETLLLNLFFSGQLRTMAPRLRSEDGRNVVIRPLCHVPESWLRAYSEQRGFQTLSCQGPGCGGPDSRRYQVKQLVERLGHGSPQLRYQMLRAMRSVRAEHLLDRGLLCRLGVEPPPEE